MVKQETKLSGDLGYIIENTNQLWPQLKGKTIFITGGTGFFGIWLVKSFLHANATFQLEANIIILTRSIEKFLSRYPELNDNGSLQFIEGDIKDFEFPATSVHYIIHAAAETNVAHNIQSPLLMLNTIVEGTRHLLDFAVASGVNSVLFTSSGGVYGKQPDEIAGIEEIFTGAPLTTDTGSAYSEGKRMAELLCAIYHKQYGVPVKIARCFAFIGPYLPLDGNFAIGNFIRNVLDDKDVIVKGDGTPVRSYMYAADLCIWLWTILMNGKSVYPYNVGSDEAFSLSQIASFVAQRNANSRVLIQQSQVASLSSASKYVPSIARAKQELNLKVGIDIQVAIDATIGYYRSEL